MATIIDRTVCGTPAVWLAIGCNTGFVCEMDMSGYLHPELVWLIIKSKRKGETKMDWTHTRLAELEKLETNERLLGIAILALKQGEMKKAGDMLITVGHEVKGSGLRLYHFE